MAACITADVPDQKISRYRDFDNPVRVVYNTNVRVQRMSRIPGLRCFCEVAECGYIFVRGRWCRFIRVSFFSEVGMSNDLKKEKRGNEMKMKKVLAVTAALAMALTVFAGCGSNSNTSSGDAETSGKTYRIATDTTFAPFEFTNDSGEFVGIDVDLLDAIAKDQGFKYTLDSIGFDAALAAVESGQADGFIAGASITSERQKKFDFSDEYYDSTVCAAVKADNAAASLDDIKGSTVAVKTGTMSASWAESIADQYALNLTYFDDSAMMYQAVNSGSAVACFEDYPVMAYGVSQNNGLKLLVEEDGDDFATPYGFGVKKDQNAELLEMFNKGLKNIQENGTYDEIVAKYIESK